MEIRLSDHFTYGRLLRFVVPSIIMMIFTSVYMVVDGLFVSNCVGKVPFAAMNLITPLLMVMSTIGFMFGTGGAAIVARLLGEGEKEKANRYFSMFVYVILISGFLLMAVGQLGTEPFARMLGAKGEMLRQSVLYARINFCSLPFFMSQIAFQSFFNTAEKPRLGLLITILAGVSNIVLDALFILGFHWGLAGASLATTVSELVGGIIPLIYFGRKNDSPLRLGRTSFDVRALLRACGNGLSEFMTNISSSVVATVYNWQLMRYIGGDGVAAYGAIMYVNFIFAAIFLGYSLGSSAIVSFNYGAGNTAELKNIFRKSLQLIAAAGALLFVLALLLRGPLAAMFAGYDKGLNELVRYGFTIVAFAFLISGFNFFGSSFFTALGNGGVSAAISFLRTLLFQVVLVLLLPRLLGADGIWAASPAAELLALGVTAGFLIRKKSVYRYA